MGGLRHMLRPGMPLACGKPPANFLVGDWAAANNVEFAYTPTNSSWLDRIEAQFTALRNFALDGTDHATHQS